MFLSIRSRLAQAAIAFVGVVLLAATVLVLVDKPMQGAALLGVAGLLLLLVVIIVLRNTLSRQQAMSRRIESRLAALEKLTSRAEWRGEQSAKQLAAEIRAANRPKLSDVPTLRRGAERDAYSGEDFDDGFERWKAAERALERLFIQQVLRQQGGGH